MLSWKDNCQGENNIHGINMNERNLMRIEIII